TANVLTFDKWLESKATASEGEAKAKYEAAHGKYIAEPSTAEMAAFKIQATALHGAGVTQVEAAKNAAAAPAAEGGAGGEGAEAEEKGKGGFEWGKWLGVGLLGLLGLGAMSMGGAFGMIVGLILLA